MLETVAAMSRSFRRCETAGRFAYGADVVAAGAIPAGAAICAAIQGSQRPALALGLRFGDEPHTYHQHARACRAPAGTTRHPPDYAPNFRPEPLAPELGPDDLAARHGVHTPAPAQRRDEPQAAPRQRAHRRLSGHGQGAA